jgi:DNA-directed RNA polymerase specialized sigma24 family protein
MSVHPGGNPNAITELDDSLANLTNAKRRVIIAMVKKNKTHKEIAEAINITVGEIKMVCKFENIKFPN